MIAHFCTWLGTTWLSVAIQSTSWVIPVTQSVHILCIAMLFASMAMLDLRLLGVAGRTQSIGGMMERAYPWVLGCLTLMALTGTILIIAEPERELMNATFRIKMLLVVMAAALTVALRTELRHHGPRWEKSRLVAKLAGAISLVLWAGIVVCGRWIAYTQ